MTRRKKTTDEWWKEPETLAVTDNPRSQKKGKRRTIFVTGYIWAAILLFPLALLTVTILGTQQMGRPDKSTAGSQVAQGSTGTAQAQVELEAWINHDPSPLPGGRVITFTGVTSKAAADAGDDGSTLKTYGFVVADQGGNLYRTTMQMAESSRGSVAVATPALVSLAPTGSDASTEGQWPWPGVEQGTAEDAFTAAVSAWTKAYTSGDPAALKQVIGDPQEGRSYMPMSGAVFTGASIEEVGNLWGKDQDQAAETRPEQVLLRVTVAVTWAGQQQSKDTDPARLTFDLLLDQANTAAPRVVAWGSPGAELAPYSNAITGRQLTVAESTEPSPTVSPSAGTGK